MPSAPLPARDRETRREGRQSHARREAREEAKNARQAVYRDLVLRAANDAFGRRGVPGTKMEDLAVEAGISLGTLYSVFQGKAEIVDALHEARLREIHAASVDAEAAETDPIEALLAGSRAYIAYFIVHPDYLKMYIDEGANWGVRDSMGRESRRGAIWSDGVAQLAAIFERGIDAGVFEPGRPDRLARTMLAMQQVALADWLEDGPNGSEASAANDVMNELEPLLLRAFCSRAGHAARDNGRSRE